VVQITGTSTTEIMSQKLVTDFVNQSGADNVVFNSENNVELREKTKILGKNESGTEYEIIGLNEYTIDDAVYDQVEIGSESVHLNLNTNEDPTYGERITVDTPNGKKQVAYTDDTTVEEGTWTPSLSSRNGTNPTYTVEYSNAKYKRVGNMCYITFHGKWNITGAGTDYACVTGLPFVAANGINGQGLATKECYGGISGDTLIVGFVPDNNSRIDIRPPAKSS
jgi:hypothetical protein